MKEESQRTLIDQTNDQTKLNEDINNIIMNDSRAQELKITFELFDTDNDNILDIEEFGNVMKSLGHEYTLTELENMIYEACQESERKINYQQFEKIMNLRGKNTDVVEEYIEAFKVFDRDGSGTINREEIKQILMSLGDDVVEEDVETMLRDADIIKGGIIEYRKFIRLLLNSNGGYS